MHDQQIKKYINEKSEQLAVIYNDANEAKAVVELWLMERLQKNRLELCTGNISLSDDTTDKLENDFKRLLNNEPIQYILGNTIFGDYKISVGKNILIPRPETEELVSLVPKYFDTNKKLNILDACTGSGCIAIYLSKIFPNSNIFAFDYTDEILNYAKKNASDNNARINFFKYNLLSNDNFENKESFDIIVSNPPYVLPEEREEMATRVKDFEPENALFVPADEHLIFYRKIIEKFANSSTRSFFEINPLCTNEWLEYGKKTGRTIQLEKDFFGKIRFAII